MRKKSNGKKSHTNVPLVKVLTNARFGRLCVILFDGFVKLSVYIHSAFTVYVLYVFPFFSCTLGELYVLRRFCQDMFCRGDIF